MHEDQPSPSSPHDPPPSAPPTVPGSVGLEAQKTSAMGVAALILGVISLLIGPLGIVALILGIVALVKINGNKSLKGSAFAIAGLVLGGVGLLLGCVMLGILLPALSAARSSARGIMSSSQLRGLSQGLVIYASNNDDWYPPEADWADLLVEQGLISVEMLTSPMSDGDADEYIYLGAGRQNEFDADRIIIYEDPDHFPHGVNVAFDDNHVEWIAQEEFEALLAEQEARDAAGDGP